MNPDIARNELQAMKWFGESGPYPFSFVYDGCPNELPNLVSTGLWDRKLKGWYIDTTKWQRTITLFKENELEIVATCTIYTDTPGYEWTITIENIGDTDSKMLSQVNALDISIPIGDPVKLHRLNGSKCQMDDWLPTVTEIERGRQSSFYPHGGRSSGGACPFFNVEWRDGGVITAIGWTGKWTACVSHDECGYLRITAGIKDLHTYLKPGEVIRLPRILQVWWEGDIEDSYNLFRKTMFAHILPRDEYGELYTPPIADLCTSSKIDNAPNEQFVYPHMAALKDRGIEAYWIDAYQHRGGFPGGMGNYSVVDVNAMTSKRRFPNGMRLVSDKAHELGMEFLLWQEPERVAPHTHIDNNYPHYVLRLPGKQYGLYNLADHDALIYITNYLDAAIDELGIDWLRIDYNIDPLPYWQAADEEARTGITEINYITNLYWLLDTLKEAHPHLKLDNCASGGRRIDLEMCSRMIPLWRSDLPGSLFVQNKQQEGAIMNQAMSASLNRYLPYSTSGCGSDSTYLFRSGFNGGIPLMEDCRLPDFPLALHNQLIQEAHSIRKYWFGNFYVLAGDNVDPTGWCVLQYHLPDTEEGIVVAFRRPDSPYKVFQCQLHDIDNREYSSYKLRRSYNPTVPHQWDIRSGVFLSMLHIDIESAPGSCIVEYKKCS